MACILNQLNKVWFNPDRIKTFRLKFDIAIIIKSSDFVATPNHALEKLFSAQLILDAWRVFSRPVFDYSDCIANFEFSLCHVFDIAPDKIIFQAFSLRDKIFSRISPIHAN